MPAVHLERFHYFKDLFLTHLSSGAASIASEAPIVVFNFDPNGPGMGLNLDFSSFDMGNIDTINVNVDCDVANFDFNNIDFNNSGSLNINVIGMNNSGTNSNPKDAPPKESKTFAEAFNPPGASTIQEAVLSNEMWAQKQKKIDEVDKGHILPEGSCRNRNTAQAHRIILMRNPISGSL